MSALRDALGDDDLPDEVEALRERLAEKNDHIEALEEKTADLQRRLEYAEELEELDPPDFQNTKWPFQGLYRAWRYKRKRRKLTSEGYVQWYLLDDTYPTPKYIKPKSKGGGIPEYEYDGSTYLFPKAAMLPSDEQGMWTCAHRLGEADPVNLRDPDADAIPADSLKEYLEMRVSTSPPGLFDKFDLDADTMMKILVFGIIGWALFQEVLGGGL